MSISTILQDLYYYWFDEHLFSSLAKINSNLAKLFVKINYGKRVWQINPLIKDSEGRELIFIHIPKCAGTSAIL